MKKFQASSDRVEVNGQTILSFVNAVRDVDMKKSLLARLTKNGITYPQPEKWYSQQSWLDAFKSIADTIGDPMLGMIGKAIPSSAKFPPDLKTTKDAFKSLDVAYHMNHRGGEIGYYKLLSYDEKARQLVMECNTPYPIAFDGGILLGLWFKFRPDTSRMPSITHTEKDGLVFYTVIW